MRSGLFLAAPAQERHPTGNSVSIRSAPRTGLRACPPARAYPNFATADFDRPPARGFTLIETLIVVAVIALLLGLLVPALRGVRGRMHALKCSSNLRTVSIQFTFFVEEGVPPAGGRVARPAGTPFYMNDFQESLYRIDEYWDLGEASSGELSVQDEMLMCPAGPKRLIKRQGFPCGRNAIGPQEDVSIGFNMRLYRASVSVGPRRMLAPVASTRVRNSILDHPYVPLVLDVDGRLATRRRMEPHYTAPTTPATPLGDPYVGNRFWFGSDRHDGRTMVGFVGGHVLNSADPQREAWDWDYQAAVGN